MSDEAGETKTKEEIDIFKKKIEATKQTHALEMELAVLKISIEGLETIQKAQVLGLDLYQIIPWKAYVDTVNELRRSPRSVVMCGQVVGEVTTLIENAVINNWNSFKTVKEMCDLTKRVLSVYSDLFERRDSDTFEVQKPLLIQTIVDGLSEIGAGQAKLVQISKAIKANAKRLTHLKVFIHGPFGSKISESIAAGAVEKKFIPGLKKILGEVKVIFEKFDKIIDTMNVEM